MRTGPGGFSALLFSSDCQGRPPMAAAGERTSKTPWGLLFSGLPPSLSTRLAKRDGGHLDAPAGRIKALRLANGCEHAPGEKSSPAGFRADGRFSNPREGRRSFSMRTRERLARRRNSPYFQQEDPAATEPSRMIIPPPSQLPRRSQPAGRERIRTGPCWLCHPIAS